MLLVDLHLGDVIGVQIVGHHAIARSHQIHAFHIELRDCLAFVEDRACGSDRDVRQLLEDVRQYEVLLLAERPGVVGNRVALLFDDVGGHYRTLDVHLLLGHGNDGVLPGREGDARDLIAEYGGLQRIRGGLGIDCEAAVSLAEPVAEHLPVLQGHHVGTRHGRAVVLVHDLAGGPDLSLHRDPAEKKGRRYYRSD